MLSMVGCGSLKDAQFNTIHVNKKEKVSSVIIEDFSKEYYDKDELKESINKAITTYNEKSKKSAVSLKKFTVKKGQTRIMMDYDTSTDYQDFNHTVLYSGTVAGAQKEGYEFKLSFTDTAGKKVKAETITAKNPDAKVIITNEPVCIQTTKNIIYVSTNATIQDAKTAKVNADNNQDNQSSQISISGYAYIIYQS